ncbi:hypothetical protein [Paenibacillus solani]|uniref:hypothetical protein n=1 Tax=Paenibacillus solani TaxID=1705565 RepID=UPI003D28C7CD
MEKYIRYYNRRRPQRKLNKLTPAIHYMPLVYCQNNACMLIRPFAKSRTDIRPYLLGR